MHMKCLNCNNNAILTKAGKQSSFCSLSCRSKYNSTATLTKRKITNLEKYGVDNPSKNTTIIADRAEKNLEKYGVSNPFSLKEVQQKQQATMLKKYGSPFASQCNELKQKQQDTWNENYGSHPWSDDGIRDKRRETLLSKYGVEHPILSDEILHKIRETCKQRYGTENASKSRLIIDKIREAHNTESVREKTRNTCIEKYGASSYQLSLIPIETRNILDSKELFEDLVCAYGVTGTADVLSLSVDTVRKRIQTYDIKIVFKSGIQQEILNFVNSLGINNISVDSRSIIPPKELDLYIDDCKFAIEVNGSYWHSELNGRDNNYHLSKLKECTSKDIELFFVWEHLWNTKKDILKSRISNKFGKNNKIYARSCNIVSVSKKEKEEFLDNNHLQGNCKSSIELGLQFDGKLCAVMTFGKPRFNSNIEWELLRFSTTKYTSVVGGASRLFKHFIKTVKPESVISYSDKQYGNGGLYKNLGFLKRNESSPGYYYTKNYTTFENRLKYQKHKLSKILPNFDSNLTEWENMQNNGYDRIWDCGNDVWIWDSNQFF